MIIGSAVMVKRRRLRLNELLGLLELIKHFNIDKNVRVTLDYYKPLDTYEIEMREYDFEHDTMHCVKRLIRVNDLLSIKIPIYEFFVKALNEMYEELKRR